MRDASSVQQILFDYLWSRQWLVASGEINLGHTGTQPMTRDKSANLTK